MEQMNGSSSLLLPIGVVVVVVVVVAAVVVVVVAPAVFSFVSPWGVVAMAVVAVVVGLATVASFVSPTGCTGEVSVTVCTVLSNDASWTSTLVVVIDVSPQSPNLKAVAVGLGDAHLPMLMVGLAVVTSFVSPWVVGGAMGVVEAVVEAVTGADSFVSPSCSSACVGALPPVDGNSNKKPSTYMKVRKLSMEFGSCTFSSSILANISCLFNGHSSKRSACVLYIIVRYTFNWALAMWMSCAIDLTN